MVITRATFLAAVLSVSAVAAAAERTQGRRAPRRAATPALRLPIQAPPVDRSLRGILLMVGAIQETRSRPAPDRSVAGPAVGRASSSSSR